MIVLAIRGTHSFKDMFTSLTGKEAAPSARCRKLCNVSAWHLRTGAGG